MGCGLFSDLLVKQLSIKQETAKTKVSETEWAVVTHPSTVGGWRAVAFCKRFRLFNRWKIVPYMQLESAFVGKGRYRCDKYMSIHCL